MGISNIFIPCTTLHLMKLNHTSSGPLSRENSVIDMPPVFILYENKWQLVDMCLIVLHQRGAGGEEELVVAWQHSQFSWTAVLDRWLNKHGFSSGGGMGEGVAATLLPLSPPCSIHHTHKES